MLLLNALLKCSQVCVSYHLLTKYLFRYLIYAKRENMKKTVLMGTALLFLFGCETGVSNKTKHTNNESISGIIDHSKVVKSSVQNEPLSGIVDKTHSKTASSNKIFSKSAQPGFYLQIAVFEKYRPNKAFLAPIEHSSFNYIVLNKYSKDYVLIGPYKSYNEAHSHIKSVKKYLHKDSFVVQVLRP